MFAAQIKPAQIHRHDLIPLLDVECGNFRVPFASADVVVEDVELTVSCHCRGGDAGAVGFEIDIGIHDRAVESICLQHGACFLGRVDVAISQNETRTFLCETYRRGATISYGLAGCLPGTDDGHNFFVQAHGDLVSLSAHGLK